jgi:hypothetical protein
MKTWNWFVQPVFTTLPILSYFQAVGLMTFVSAVIWQHNTTKKIKPEYLESPNTVDVTALLMPWMVLFISWLVNFVI